MPQNSEIVKAAQKFCKENRIDSYPVDIITICNNNGLRVFEEYLPTNVSGYIIIQEEPFEKYETNKVIVVNSSDNPKRRRFTIAHELAHFVLHKSAEENFYAHRDTGQYDGIEREADIFASNILMPEELIKEELKNLNEKNRGDIPFLLKTYQIANSFAVSEMAAEVRLKQLGLR